MMIISFSGSRVLLPLIGLLIVQVFFLFSEQAWADKRHPDPDGCFSCHGLPDLKYIDKDGQIRSASILKADYYGSLHGSVPCKDCHRKIVDYPHEEKDGLVNCGEKCHVKEPSEGKAFTHKDIVKEFKASVHGKGLTKGFAAGNRYKEENDSSLPSCRRCHANVPYIAANQWEAFKEAFAHNDAECGTCHQGDTWMNQYSGHILRRFVGNRINKNDSNSMCIECHGNLDKMEKVEIEDPKTKKKKPAGLRFVHSVESYQKTLHARLLADKSFDGASCVDCHAPTGMHHGILRDEHEAATTHVNNLPKTCGQAGCHQGYANSVANQGFLLTDLHNAAWVSVNAKAAIQDLMAIPSAWHSAFYVLGPLSVLFIVGSLLWSAMGDAGKLSKNSNNSILGADKFQTIIIGTKGKKSKKRKDVGLNLNVI
jgi:sulfite reductase (NADPH) flavoprotein alpha-component